MIVTTLLVSSALAEETCFPISELILAVVGGGRSPQSIVVEERSVCVLSETRGGVVADRAVLGDLARPVDDIDYEETIRILRAKGDQVGAERYERQWRENGSPRGRTLTFERYSDAEMARYLHDIVESQSHGTRYTIFKSETEWRIAPSEGALLDRTVVITRERCPSLDRVEWSPSLAHSCAFGQLVDYKFVPGLWSKGTVDGYAQSEAPVSIAELLRAEAAGRPTMTKVWVSSPAHGGGQFGYELVYLPIEPRVIPRIVPELEREDEPDWTD